MKLVSRWKLPHAHFKLDWFQELIVKASTTYSSLSGSSVHEAKRGAILLQFAANKSIVTRHPCRRISSEIVSRELTVHVGPTIRWAPVCEAPSTPSSIMRVPGT